MRDEPGHGYDVVLFDLGGVVIELGGESVFSAWVGESSRDELWRRWLTSPAVRAFETGRMQADAFATAMVDEFELPVSAGAFLDLFTGWPKGWYDGAPQLLRDVRERAPLACLSNSNAPHWERFRAELDIESYFDASFPSHHLGVLKPDRHVFDLVVERLDVAPDRVLFLDDNQINVDGAREAGLVAEHVRGVDGARALLTRHGVLG